MSLNIYIETYGCQMNEADSQIIRTILEKKGHNFINSEKTADIVLLNTCSVRDNADRKEINRVKYLKYKNANQIIGILGCLATSKKEELLAKKLEIDFIVGPDNYQELPGILEKVLATRKKISQINISKYETYENIYPHQKNEVNARIPIMRGCNNFCSYCVVPYARGPERSRNYKSILKEINKLASENCSQITLLGQNVNSYKYEDINFVDLIKMVSDINKIKRIRFISPHPKDLSLDLIMVMAERDNICNHLHLPLQSGNSRILKQMNRTYTKEKYLELIHQIRRQIPNIVLTTDIIIGFPTETEEEFQDTVQVVKEVEFDSAFIFKYSPRPQTYAAKNYPDDIPEEEKTERIIKLNKIQNEISLKKNQIHINEIQEIMLEKTKTKKDDNYFQGRNSGNKVVIFPKGNHRVGEYIKVKIIKASANTLRGKIIKSSF